MMTFIQKSKMISLLKQYKRVFAWFLSGLVMAALLFLGTSNQQPATATVSNQIHATTSTQLDLTDTYSDFGATHLEPNFYQY
ncbi:hypothetical protein [Nostoc sp. CHAB 5836]|uniref:hypothetical protein n=1 Tax=Nostoc sp. CHAB 5836 TaxID=2780404 RepID=UPI001E2DBC71|nr:hypothetical protein [Nostoc sp. CHAB 5836]